MMDKHNSHTCSICHESVSKYVDSFASKQLIKVDPPWMVKPWETQRLRDLLNHTALDLNFRIRTCNHYTILSFNNSTSSFNGQLESLRKGLGLGSAATKIWDFWDLLRSKDLGGWHPSERTGTGPQDVFRVGWGGQRQHTQAKVGLKTVLKSAAGPLEPEPPSPALRFSPVHAAVGLGWRHLGNTRFPQPSILHLQSDHLLSTILTIPRIPKIPKWGLPRTSMG